MSDQTCSTCEAWDGPWPTATHAVCNRSAEDGAAMFGASPGDHIATKATFGCNQWTEAVRKAEPTSVDHMAGKQLDRLIMDHFLAEPSRDADFRPSHYWQDAGVVIGRMKELGSSFLLNWGEDTNAWECSWLLDGQRHNGAGSTAQLAVCRSAVKWILAEGKQAPAAPPPAPPPPPPPPSPPPVAEPERTEPAPMPNEEPAPAPMTEDDYFRDDLANAIADFARRQGVMTINFMWDGLKKDTRGEDAPDFGSFVAHPTPAELPDFKFNCKDAIINEIEAAYPQWAGRRFRMNLTIEVVANGEGVQQGHGLQAELTPL